MIKVSIIVPVYNVEKYISKCIESLVNQTLKDIEIIIVNDGSPDNSQKIIDKYVSKYPKLVKSFIKENGGQGSARNYGLSKAKGEYILYVDSDDYIDKKMAEILYEKAKKENSDITICSYKLVSETGRILNIEHINKNIIFEKMAVWNKIYKKQFLIQQAAHFRTKVWYEDLDFTIKLLFSTKNISYVDEPFYNYLLRDGSTMNNTNVEKNLELLDAFDSALIFLKQNKLFDDICNHEQIEFLATYHIYLTGITRLINIKCKNKIKKEVINSYINYMKQNFPDFERNKFINQLPIGKKIIFYLINFRLYFIIKVLFILKGRIKWKK